MLVSSCNVVTSLDSTWTALATLSSASIPSPPVLRSSIPSSCPRCVPVASPISNPPPRCERPIPIRDTVTRRPFDSLAAASTTSWRPHPGRFRCLHSLLAAWLCLHLARAAASSQDFFDYWFFHLFARPPANPQFPHADSTRHAQRSISPRLPRLLRLLRLPPPSPRVSRHEPWMSCSGGRPISPSIRDLIDPGSQSPRAPNIYTRSSVSHHAPTTSRPGPGLVPRCDATAQPIPTNKPEGSCPWLPIPRRLDRLGQRDP